MGALHGAASWPRAVCEARAPRLAGAGTWGKKFQRRAATPACEPRAGQRAAPSRQRLRPRVAAREDRGTRPAVGPRGGGRRLRRQRLLIPGLAAWPRATRAPCNPPDLHLRPRPAGIPAGRRPSLCRLRRLQAARKCQRRFVVVSVSRWLGLAGWHAGRWPPHDSVQRLPPRGTPLGFRAGQARQAPARRVQDRAVRVRAG